MFLCIVSLFLFTFCTSFRGSYFLSCTPALSRTLISCLALIKSLLSHVICLYTVCYETGPTAHTYCVHCLFPHSVSQALLGVPELRSRALLAGSSVVHALCRRSSSPCVRLPQVQTFVQMLQDSLGAGCEGEEPGRVSEVCVQLQSTHL